MKKLLAGQGWWALIVPMLLAVGGGVAAQETRDHRKETQRRDHRSQTETRDHRTSPAPSVRVAAQPSPAVSPDGGQLLSEYRTSWHKPSVIPRDLENWLNIRMRGFELVGVDKDEESGRYDGFFAKQQPGNEDWTYRVRVVPADDIVAALDEAVRRRWWLVAIEGEMHGWRGLHYICFYREL